MNIEYRKQGLKNHQCQEDLDFSQTDYHNSMDNSLIKQPKPVCESIPQEVSNNISPFEREYDITSCG